MSNRDKSEGRSPLVIRRLREARLNGQLGAVCDEILKDFRTHSDLELLRLINSTEVGKKAEAV